MVTWANIVAEEPVRSTWILEKMLMVTMTGLLTNGYKYERNKGFSLGWVAGRVVFPSTEKGIPVNQHHQ